MSYLNSVHPTHGEEYAEFQCRRLSSLDVFGFVDQDASNMYDWLRWVVERHLPISEVENKLTQQLVKMRPTTAETLKAYMQRLASRVGSTIGGEMGTSFGLMFDRWSSRVKHFVGVFAVYHAHGQRQQRLIGLSPMDDGFTADAHIEHLDAVLGVYRKTLSMVKFLAADNCSTNQSIATKMGVPLIGCASRRFNLAVQKVLLGYESEIAQIQNLMTHLRFPNNAAELERHTELRPCAAMRPAGRLCTIRSSDMFESAMPLPRLRTSKSSCQESQPNDASLLCSRSSESSTASLPNCSTSTIRWPRCAPSLTPAS